MPDNLDRLARIYVEGEDRSAEVMARLGKVWSPTLVKWIDKDASQENRPSNAKSSRPHR